MLMVSLLVKKTTFYPTAKLGRPLPTCLYLEPHSFRAPRQNIKSRQFFLLPIQTFPIESFWVTSVKSLSSRSRRIVTLERLAPTLAGRPLPEGLNGLHGHFATLHGGDGNYKLPLWGQQCHTFVALLGVGIRQKKHKFILFRLPLCSMMESRNFPKHESTVMWLTLPGLIFFPIHHRDP